MLMILIILFAITAMFGVYLISYILPEKNTPKGIAILHGTVGAIGIITLFIASFFNHSLIYSLILFVLAAIGGGVLFSLDILGKKIPKFLALGHGLIAVCGFVVLILVAMNIL